MAATYIAVPGNSGHVHVLILCTRCPRCSLDSLDCCTHPLIAYYVHTLAQTVFLGVRTH